MTTHFRHLKFILALCLGPSLAGAASAATVEVNAGLATPVVRAGKAQNVFLKVGMTGVAMPGREDRPPANVALVIDKSGSMAGDRIVRAREAAILAVNSLNANDIVSVIAFDQAVDVVIPATRLADKRHVVRAIEAIQTGGQTALFAGVSKGAAEVRKFQDRNRVNRVILLSDGQANVGPSSPAELGQLGALLGRQGMSVTTIGLGNGYNEDLMTQLASYSDGNHAFAEKPGDLVRIFQREFGDVAAVVAQEVEVVIRLKPGIRPVRILGREGEIVDGTVRLRMNQLYSEQEKYVLVEAEVPLGRAGERRDLAAVDVSYLNMKSGNQDRVSRAVAVSFSESEEAVARATDRKAMVSAVEQVANSTSKRAVELRDQGRPEAAKRLMESNAGYISSQRAGLGAEGDKLKSLETEVVNQGVAIDKKDAEAWNIQRKVMRESQYKLEKQQK